MVTLASRTIQILRIKLEASSKAKNDAKMWNVLNSFLIWLKLRLMAKLIARCNKTEVHQIIPKRPTPRAILIVHKMVSTHSNNKLILVERLQCPLKLQIDWNKLSEKYLNSQTCRKEARCHEQRVARHETWYDCEDKTDKQATQQSLPASTIKSRPEQRANRQSKQIDQSWKQENNFSLLNYVSQIIRNESFTYRANFSQYLQCSTQFQPMLPHKRHCSPGWNDLRDPIPQSVLQWTEICPNSPA